MTERTIGYRVTLTHLNRPDHVVSRADYSGRRVPTEADVITLARADAGRTHPGTRASEWTVGRVDPIPAAD